MPAGRSRAALVGLVLVVLVGLTSCGVPVQTTAESLPPNVLPSPLRIPAPSPSATPSPTATATATETSAPAVPSADASAPRLRLWFVQEDGLAAADSDLPEGTSPDLIVQSLSIGPTAAQLAEGLRTVARDPLTGLALVSAAVPIAAPVATPSTSAAVPTPTGTPSFPPSASASTAAPVTVQLSPAFAALPPTEQVLLLGQVVLSLTGSGAKSVAFTDAAGTPVAVPLPDGRLLDAPATVRDYTSLIIRP